MDKTEYQTSAGLETSIGIRGIETCDNVSMKYY